MKEQAVDVLAEAGRSGRWGFSSCAYACPGCPASRDVDALIVRVVGWNPDLAADLGRGPRRAWELISGVLPVERDVWVKLKAAGIQRAFTPVFCNSDGPAPVELPELAAVHDAESGLAGSLSGALEALSAASAAGVPAGIVAAGDRRGTPPTATTLRVLVRLAWSIRVSVEASSGGAPPCIARIRDYNQLHL